MSQTSENESAALRSELYAARRTIGRLEQDLSQVTAGRDQLAQQLQHLQAQASPATEELVRLRAEVDMERQARIQAVEALQKVTHERQRLQRARDELAKNVLAAQQRIAEAEEDQLRAEEMRAAAVTELHSLQARVGRQDAEPSPNANGDLDHQSTHAGPEEALEVERSKNAVLVAALTSAKAERDRAAADAATAQERLRQLLLSQPAGPPPPRSQNAQRQPPASANGSALPNLDTDSASPEAIAAHAAALQRQVAQLKASRDKLLAELEIQFVDAERMANENSALSQALEDARDAAEKWERQAEGGLAQMERLKDLLEESALWGSGGSRSRSEAAADAGAGSRLGAGDAESLRGGSGAGSSVDQSGSDAAASSAGRRGAVDAAAGGLGGAAGSGVGGGGGGGAVVEGRAFSRPEANGNGHEEPAADAADANGVKVAADLEATLADLEQNYMQECARSAALDLQVRALCAELSRAAAVAGHMGRSLLPALSGIESRLAQVLHTRPADDCLPFRPHAGPDD